MNRSEAPDFPDPREADAEGLVRIGGSLAPSWLFVAYSRGIFPWPIAFPDGHVLAWFSPDPRAILDWRRLHLPRRLRRRLRRHEFVFSCDTDFAGVVRGCAALRPGESTTWITPQMARAYRQFHRLGFAHSVEVWQDGALVGGLYGVALGGLFCGESMFHRVRDASKAAIVALCFHLWQRGYVLFDIQQATDHMVRLGAATIPRDVYLERLAEAIRRPVVFAPETWEASMAAMEGALARGRFPWNDGPASEEEGRMDRPGCDGPEKCRTAE